MGFQPPWDVFRSGPSAMRVVVVSDERSAVECALARLQLLAERSDTPLVGLATGNTFREFFSELVAREVAGRIDLRGLAFTHLDEYVGCGPDEPGGMVHELRTTLFDRLSGGVAEFHPVPSESHGGKDAGRLHANLLARLRRMDLQFLGLGRNGHVAFNEPGTPFSLGSHRAVLAEETRRANASRFPGRDHPREAVTSGPRDLLRAQSLVLMAFGEKKARAVQSLLEGPIAPECPATVLRLHADATIILDRAAASRLSGSARKQPTKTPKALYRMGDLNPDGPVLVASPHPDDASISCGGWLGNMPKGTRKVIATMTTGARARVQGVSSPAGVATLRESEVREEARILGAEAHFLKCSFYDSGAFEPEDVERTRALIAEIDPVWIAAPSRSDPHPTHRMSRLILDEALGRHVLATGKHVDVWTFEGPWYLHPHDDVNALVLFDEEVSFRKLEAVRCHRSQMQRVPFDQGAAALARLRAVSFSESDLGGTEPGHLDVLPHLEVFVRTRVVPSAW